MPVTVTNGPWGVSVTTGTGIDGAILNVYRPGPKYRSGDHDKMRFASSEEASAFALLAGYTRVYYRRRWCPICRKPGHNLIRKDLPGSECSEHGPIGFSAKPESFIPERALPLPG